MLGNFIPYVIDLTLPKQSFFQISGNNVSFLIITELAFCFQTRASVPKIGSFLSSVLKRILAKL